MCWRRKIKTSFGLRIDANNVPGLPTKEAHEHALTIFVEGCSRHFDEAVVREAVSGITVEWWDKIAPRPSTGELNTVVAPKGGGLYSGLTIGSLCMIAWRGRLWRSAFCHELLHVVDFTATGVSDPYHANAVLWSELEPELNRRLLERDL